MGILDKLFGKQKPDPEWPGFKEQLVKLLKEKTEIKFSWESGGDEAFLTFEDFAAEAQNHENYELEDFIIEKLDIPSAGEFSMKGVGILYIADNKVRAKYVSEMKEVVDYDEEKEEEIYGDEEIKDEGDEILFAV